VFRQRLAEEIARAGRYQHSLVVVLLEPANLLADPTEEAYARAAKALRQSLRLSDFAGQFDEERFLVLLSETDRAGAQVIGQRLLADLRSASDPPVRWRGVLVSYPEDGANPDALIDRAFGTLRQGRLESALGSPAPAQPEAQQQPSE
jgi:GGDEF domain-containing protein